MQTTNVHTNLDAVFTNELGHLSAEVFGVVNKVEIVVDAECVGLVHRNIREDRRRNILDEVLRETEEANIVVLAGLRTNIREAVEAITNADYGGSVRGDGIVPSSGVHDTGEEPLRGRTEVTEVIFARL